MHSCTLAHTVLCSCIHCTRYVGVGAGPQYMSLYAQMLTTKKSQSDILKLFNQQPQSTLFAGSPAQVSLVWALQIWAAQHPLISALRTALQTSELMQALPACQYRICSSSLPAATAPCKDLQLPATATLQHPRRSRCRHMDQGRLVSMCRHVCSNQCAATRLVNTRSTSR